MRENKTSIGSLEPNLRLHNRLQKDGFYWIEDLLQRVDARRFVRMYGRAAFRTMQAMLNEDGFKFRGTANGTQMTCTSCEEDFWSYEGYHMTLKWEDQMKKASPVTVCHDCHDQLQRKKVYKPYGKLSTKIKSISALAMRSVDLPEEPDLWLINCETGLIESWDHEENPNSGNDTHALFLSIQALGKEEWTHPAHSRKDAAEAVEYVLSKFIPSRAPPTGN